MDVTLLTVLAATLVALIVLITTVSRRFTGRTPSETPENAAPRPQPVRRAAGVRNARRRMRAGAAAEPVANEESDGEDEEAENKIEVPDGKMGAKKRAKLDAKADRKMQREAMEREREERKKKEQQLQEESDKQREREKLEEQQQEEALRKAKEEKERREHEEYLKMKEAFSVEEEGFDEAENSEDVNLLQQFVDYVKRSKVVVLEDLASHFRMKTASAIERIVELQAEGTLTGVIDDRGKFIYITQGELEAVAKFVRQRGRVSITDLAENSNRLINLNADAISVESA